MEHTILAPRSARREDTPALVAMIRELAVFEKLEHLFTLQAHELEAQLFGARPIAEAVIVEAADSSASEPIAFALFFHNFSTFLGKPGLYLEDLYVRPDWRALGIGKTLLQHLAGLALERGCGRFEWSVLDWNTRAIEVYRGVGAQVLDDWRICRVTGDALERLGKG